MEGKNTVFTTDNINAVVSEVMADSEYRTLVEEVKNLKQHEKDCVLAFILGLTMKINQSKRSVDTCYCNKQ